jgi:hypothetical protein
MHHYKAKYFFDNIILIKCLTASIRSSPMYIYYEKYTEKWGQKRLMTNIKNWEQVTNVEQLVQWGKTESLYCHNNITTDPKLSQDVTWLQHY